MQDIIDQAVTRTRTRLKHVTTASHDGLQEFLVQLLKHLNIKVLVPEPVTVLTQSNISAWPPEDLYESVVQELAKAGVARKIWGGDGLDSARDKVAGHCKETALYLTRHAVHQLEEKKRTNRKLCFRKANRSALACLKEMRTETAVKDMFGIFLEGHDIVRIENVIYGGEQLPKDILRLTEQALQHKAIQATPVYILLYEFDGDELDDDDLKQPGDSAQYGIHALGLIIDGVARVAYVCDPNGGVYANGNYEFLKIPIKERIGLDTTCDSVGSR
jgi:hypothetical protein